MTEEKLHYLVDQKTTGDKKQFLKRKGRKSLKHGRIGKIKDRSGFCNARH